MHDEWVSNIDLEACAKISTRNGLAIECHETSAILQSIEMHGIWKNIISSYVWVNRYESRYITIKLQTWSIFRVEHQKCDACCANVCTVSIFYTSEKQTSWPRICVPSFLKMSSWKPFQYNFIAFCYWALFLISTLLLLLLLLLFFVSFFLCKCCFRGSVFFVHKFKSSQISIEPCFAYKRESCWVWPFHTVSV